MKRILFLLNLTLFSYPSHADILNYCHDDAANKQWQQLMEANGQHPEWQVVIGVVKS